ncbi:MAG TPA: anaerobic sulfatase maturase [Ktedonobacteraceae bacterium]|nr:anaerobic sulfatase maturase [Ktedonobacteraceae bacterium]
MQTPRIIPLSPAHAETQTIPGLPDSWPKNAPTYFHVLSKPSGATCNLDCTYCFFLSKEKLYPNSRFRMSEETLETYIRQLLESQRAPEVTIAWQGGEPTLMGLDFFKRAVDLVQAYARPGVEIQHTMQTNGILLNDDWCKFFLEHHFLIGLSLDGPQAMHDTYRVDKGGAPTFQKVLRAARLLQEHRVEFNILTTVNAANADHPLEVYRYLRDEVGTQFIQFIPIVERINEQGEIGFQEGSQVSERSVKSEQWGTFLITIFDEWVRRDVGTVFIQMFDAALASWYGAPPALCIFAETCGNALALEHNGDLYSCDHFVEPKYLLGNIKQKHMIELVSSEKQRQFGLHKRDSLPNYCRDCQVRFACNGECPKNRFIETPDGESGLNYLCAGYKAFFIHIDKPMRIMAELLRRDRAPAEVKLVLAAEEAELQKAFAKAGRNELCPCGSGRKFKQCHGR